jgi:hypothetical protein
MKGRTIAATALAMAVAACGGGSSGGGGVASTPGPSYTKIVDMSGNRTFQTAGVQYTVSTGVISDGVGHSMGSGVTVAYTAASDSYQLTAPDGSTVTFGAADFVPARSIGTTLVYVKVSGTGQDEFILTVPNSAAIPLSYTVVGTWLRVNGATGISRLAVGGSPTLASDMPKTGTASYAIGIGGGANAPGGSFALAGNSTGTFSANFGNGTVATTLNLAGAPSGGGAVQSFGSFTGSGTITSNGPGFAGTLTGAAANGLFSGSFFGPQAAELGFGYYLNGADFSAAGVAVGARQ